MRKFNFLVEIIRGSSCWVISFFYSSISKPSLVTVVLLFSMVVIFLSPAFLINNFFLTPPVFFLIAENQKRITRRGSEWEILEGLKEGQRFDKKPDMFSGYLHKKRKWPLKGWYKVSGILIYRVSRINSTPL